VLWIGVAVVSLVSIWMALWVAQTKAQVGREITNERSRITDQKQAFEKAKEERERREREEHSISISEPQAYQVAAARLLLQRKSLSWTRILSDLEKYVPENTRITSVQVQEIYDTGNNLVARIQLKAVGIAPAEMTTMMTSLEKSHGLFYVGEVSQEPTDEAGEVPFTLNLTYQPSMRQEQ
jgi:Tfp pilus assembly protein PilN